jgi:hypothetical protein
MKKSFFFVRFLENEKSFPLFFQIDPLFLGKSGNTKSFVFSSFFKFCKELATFYFIGQKNAEMKKAKGNKFLYET